jgi:ZIP family zinc transporter
MLAAMSLLDWFGELHPVKQAVLAGLFTWGVTALGAAAVFMTREVSRRLLDSMLGFSGGVMIAASYWSLLAPSIAIAEHDWHRLAWVPAAGGFVLGAAAIYGLDKVLPHVHLFLARDRAEGLTTRWRRSVLLIMAITMHNIPEGLAVGVAFGGVIDGVESTDLTAAVALAIGIGLQNFPEGMAVAMPLRGEGMSRAKSFWYGQLSAMVEPMAAALGAWLVLIAAPILPWALAFAAGAMIFVVVEELIPESQRAGNDDLATISLIFGFALMMTLDVALG